MRWGGTRGAGKSISEVATKAGRRQAARYDIAAFRHDIGDVPDDPRQRGEAQVARLFLVQPGAQRAAQGEFAEVVASPRNEAEVIRAAAACAKARIPLVVRGAGTGNYGQAVPLEGGVILEMAALDAIEWIKPGLVRVGAGGKMVAVDAETRRTALSCACTPRRSAWRRSAASSPAARAASAR